MITYSAHNCSDGSDRHTGKVLLLTVLLSMILAGTGVAIAQDDTNTADADSETKSANAQNGGAVARKQDESDVLEEVTVIGTYSRSLQASLNLKQNTTAFVDSISSEDIGKFPELNLAEALARVPGVQISRQNGEGQQISLRGLGPSFVRVLLHGSPFSIASTGAEDQFAGNRELDFDIFPTELFTQVVVQKTPFASTVEGGLAGTLNLRNARPFDYDEDAFTFGARAQYSELSGETDPRGHFLWSKTWNDTFGILVGYAFANRSFRTDGFNTINWAQGAVNDLRPSDGSLTGFRWNVDNGNLSGLTDQQLADTKTPRLARPDLRVGDREREGAMFAAQWRPTEDLSFNLDYYYSNLEQDFERFTNNMLIRGTGPGSFFGYVTPVDFTVNENNSLTSGTLQDIRYWSENRPIETDVDFQSIVFSGDWIASDSVTMDWALSHNDSEWKRRATTFLFLSNPTTTQFGLDGNLPVLSPNVELADDANWNPDFVRIQPESREEDNTSLAVNFTFGDPSNNFKVGAFYHEFDRDSQSFFLGGSLQSIHDQFGTPGTSIALDQIAQPSLNVADWGSDFSSGTPGYNNWLVGNFATINQAFDFDAMYAAAPLSPLFSGITGEDTLAAYIEANSEHSIMGYDVRINLGVRYVDRDDEARGWFVTNEGELEQIVFSNTESDLLPSFNVAVDLTDTVILRFASARTMTRADPSQKEPRTRVAVGTAAVQQGNPFLEPFFATQVDLGLEWYFAERSLLAANFFSKDIDGFTRLATEQRPFGDAGIPLEILDPSVLVGLPDGLDTEVPFSTWVNSPEEVSVKGIELLYQQPLDMLLQGLGFSVNYTWADDSGDRPIIGLSENSYNVIGYYERDRFNVRLSLNHRGKNATCDAPCQDAQPDVNYRDASTYLDLSAGFRLTDNLLLTVDGINLTEEEEYTYFGAKERLTELFAPGRVYTVGITGTW